MALDRGENAWRQANFHEAAVSSASPERPRARRKALRNRRDGRLEIGRADMYCSIVSGRLHQSVGVTQRVGALGHGDFSRSRASLPKVRM